MSRYKKRLCKTTGCNSTANPRSQYCSECSVASREVKLDIYRHNWKTNNPEKYKECYTEQNKKHSETNYNNTRKTFLRCADKIEKILSVPA